MKKCLICDQRLKFIKFKCKDGHVCKTCYEKVSANFTHTITGKTKKELLEIYDASNLKVTQTDQFMMTRKINQLILFDDQKELICLPNHIKYCKEARKPEIYPFSMIKTCEIERKQMMVKEKTKTKALGTIKVSLGLKLESTTYRDIWLIPNPIPVDSTAYKTMLTLAQKIKLEVGQTMKEAVSC